MDPQYRQVLELAVDAIRDSAISLDRETVGVFIGSSIIHCSIALLIDKIFKYLLVVEYCRVISYFGSIPYL